MHQSRQSLVILGGDERRGAFRFSGRKINGTGLSTGNVWKKCYSNTFRAIPL